MSEHPTLARQAMDKAVEADNKIKAHEDICAIRYENINDTLSRIMKIIGWGGTALAGLVLSVLGWAMVHLFEANERAVQALQERDKLTYEQSLDSKPLETKRL